MAGAASGVQGAYYLAGLALLIKLDARTTTTNIVAVLVFNLLMFALLAMPLLGLLYAPDRTRARSSESWTTGCAVIAAVAAGTIGLYLLIAGFIDLS